MFPHYLPSSIEQLSEPSAIALAQNIQSEAIGTPLVESAIATTYVYQGSSGVPVLLLHGFDSSILEFRKLIPILAEKNATWAVDLLGFGFTNRQPDLVYSPLAIKTHLYHFWKTMIHQPIILVGASMGGAAAIDFTLSFPDVVQKLILMDSAGLKGGSPVSKLLFPPLDYLAAKFLRSPKVRDRICRSAFKNQNLVSQDTLLCGAMHLQMPNWDRALISFAKSGGYQAFRPEQLSQITQPTLILWGDTDRILGTQDAERFTQLIPQSKLIWIQDCGHIPHLEQPEIVAQHILDFQ